MAGLVKLYFNIFGMPWRMREIPYAAMVSAGRAAIEQLMHDIESFIQEKIKFDSHAFERFRSQLHHAEQKMNDYYKTVEIQNQRPARVALENTVYILHELIYDIGEELRLVPRRNEKSVNQNALGILAKKQIFPIL